MFLFIFYLFSVVVYVIFLLWLIFPIFKGTKHQWRIKTWLRVILGILQIISIKIPLLGPLLFLILFISSNDILSKDKAVFVEDFYVAVSTFPTTVPAYIHNVLNFRSKKVTSVYVKYPIKIGDLNYEPIVRTNCFTRRKIALDKGVSIHTYNNYPTAHSGELLAKTKDHILALNHSSKICSHLKAKKLKLGHQNSFFQFNSIYIIRRNAEKTKFYEINYKPNLKKHTVDEFTAFLPEVLRIEETTTKNLIHKNLLWPWRQKNDRDTVPNLITAYKELPRKIKINCISHIYLGWDYRKKKMTVRRVPTKKYNKNWNWKKLSIPEDLRNQFCRDEFSKHLPTPSLLNLEPIINL